MACGIQFPDQGLNIGPTHWELGVLATGLQGSSCSSAFKLESSLTSRAGAGGNADLHPVTRHQILLWWGCREAQKFTFLTSIWE